MRLSVVINLMAVLQVSALSSSAQTAKVSIQANNVNIREAFREIERNSGISFLFYDDAIDLKKNITVSAIDCPLSELLDKILKDTNLTYKVYDNKFIVVSPVEAVQQQTITGTITDAANNEPLPGVNITIEGTTLGAVSDIDGKFSINVPSTNAVLVFSFVGYNTEKVTLTGQATLSVSLIPDIKSLEEVVVVGYGTQKKVNMTGAVSAVKVDEKITSRALTNVSSSLSGLVPGLAVNQNSGMAGNNGATMVIRGLGSVNTSSPLVVVDGMPDVDINRINMNDIESVSVLKDATSSAVYGSRAANGVILITTKSGKGQNKNKINFSGTYGVTLPTRAYDFMADYPRALTLHQRAASTSILPSNQKFRNGTIDQWMALGMIDPLRYPNTDWWDVIMRKGQVQNYNLSSSGGNEKSNFFVSIGMMDEKGLQIANDYSRYNARFNYDYKVNKNMNLGAKFSGNWSNMTYSLEDGFIDDDATNTAGFDLQYAIAGITPYDPVSGYYGGVMAYNEDPQAYNPYTVYVNTLTHRNRQEVNPSLYWDWTPLKGLTARVDYAINYYNQFSYNASTPNRAYNFQTGTYGSRIYVGDNAGISNTTNTGYKTMLNGRLNYEKTIAMNHNLSGMFVYSEEYWYARNQSSSRSDRVYPTLEEVDAALTIPGKVSAGGNSETEGLRSYIGRLNYSAYDKYLLEANFRYDGSSKFLKGHQYGFFPSAALGWRFTEEGFIKSVTQNWLSSGKFRFSYGALGNNSGVKRYEQREVLDQSHYMVDGNIGKGLVYQKMVNEDLSWESTSV
ncbi:MAG TPA: SusC/RagA family TonB-linked outer membrane protein, partial [Bacteroidales bacterium]|nr:SusC/RagA family TonB-linked outer membrane protein [Bacteroidales bacterium]